MTKQGESDMEEKVKISVIIPVYNTAQYLPRCLDSVLQNTYTNLEIICINDGSTDNSVEILEQYKQKDRRIIVVNKTNGGVSSARNMGLDMATGDYIAFIDSDDWIHPQYFATMADVIDEDQYHMVACNYATVQQYEPMSSFTVPVHKSKFTPLLLTDVVESQFLKRLVWGRIYSKLILRGIRFDADLSWGEDTVFNLMALLGAQNFRGLIVDVHLYFYFCRGGSLSNTVSYERRFRLPQWYLDNHMRFEDTKMRKCILDQACKEILASRYLEMFNPEKEHIAALCKGLAANCQIAMRKSNLYSKIELLKYRILLSFPNLYRLLRIVNDRTLLAWEENMKKKYTRLDS